ncbi:MAG: DUF2240 family protein [Candidatus Woesearchaeota archaeon]
MLKIPYEKLLEILARESNLETQEIEKLVQEKLNQFSNILSKEGAALLVAHDLRIDFGKFNEVFLKVNELYEGDGINIVLRIIRDNGISDFIRKDGQPGRVKSYFASDDTGSTRIVLWNDLIEAFPLEEHATYELRNVNCKKNNSFYEIHLTSKSLVKKLEINEPVSKTIERRIYELNEEGYFRIMGFVVKIFEPRQFLTCPICKKRVQEICQDHPNEKPEENYMVTFLIDDSTGVERVALFKEIIESLTSLDNINSFLGELVIVEGKVTFNSYSNRYDMVAKRIKIVNDPETAIEFLKNFIY